VSEKTQQNWKSTLSQVFSLPMVRWGQWAVLWCVVLWGVFRSQPPPLLFNGSDKWQHVLAFGLLVWSAYLTGAGCWFRRLVWPVIVMALISEWLQAWWQPTRQMSVGDMYANLAGIGVALAMIASRRFKFTGS
jgi:hypothetical protein